MLVPKVAETEFPTQGDSDVSTVPTALQSDADATSVSSIDEDPVVIVGMACHLPGQVSSPSDLWTLLSDNKSAQGAVPKERFNIKGYYHPDGKRAGAMNVLGGYFLKEDVRDFENSFFGINNMEATYMDPQQRKLLEVVFECFEDAGVSMEGISGSDTGVYVGNFTVDFQAMQTRDPDYMHRYMATGSGTAIMSNRISYIFNLQGPSMTLDTACSSSIYALHQAVAALRTGDCNGAVVAGANLITAPEQHLGTMKGGVLSPTSTCHTFDTSADGYGRAEGVNAIYVKRLSTALRDGDKIRAIIRSTAINANGRTNGITLPSADLQEKVIRKAYAEAGLDFADTDYVECHGTGTAVGDPIEVDALSRCFSPREGFPLRIGSVKTNLGHSEAASGLTSIIKAVLAFDKGAIPPTHGVVNINPKLKLEERNMHIVRQVERWPRALRRAGINSFGYGGANAHVVLEAVDSYLGSISQIPSAITVGDAQTTVVLPISAGSTKSLEARLEQITQLLPRYDAAALQDLAYTLSRRSQLRVRQYLLAQASSGIKGAKLIEPSEASTVTTGAEALPFGFVFTGQGAQYAGMAKELLDQNEIFTTAIRSMDKVLKALPAEHAPDWTLEETILASAETSRVNEVSRSQPICTAIQVGLVQVLRSWGVSPSVVVGHSSGEIGAAYATGLLDASQAILAAYFRGYAVQKLTSQGAMMAAGLDAASAKTLIEEKELSGRVVVACVNAPESVTLSGDVEGIEALQADLQAEGKFARKLVTGGRAYHSHMMTEIGDLYEDLLKPHLPTQPKSKTPGEVHMYSSVGVSSDNLRVLDSSSEISMASYWRQNLENPVQFDAALSNLAAAGKYQLLEVGPHSALKGPIKQIRTAIKKDNNSLPYVSSLVRGQDAGVALKQLAGALFVNGHVLNWNKVHQTAQILPKPSILHDLPPYPWDYSAGQLWYEPRASVEMRNRKYVRHELLGTAALTGNGIDWSWRNILRLAEIPWMRDHKLEDQVVFPGAGYLAIATEAISQVQGLKEGIYTSVAQDVMIEFRNVNISEALLLDEQSGDDVEVHTTLSPTKLSAANVSPDWYDFTVTSWASSGQATTAHCTGGVRVVRKPDASQIKGTVTVTNRQGYETWPMNRWYDKLKEEGLVFGKHFQSLTSLQTDGNRTLPDAVATTQLKPPVERQPGGTAYPVHPITIDACLQAAIMGGTAGNVGKLNAYMPVFITECRLKVPPKAVSDALTDDIEIHTKSTATGFSTRRIDCTLRGPDASPIIDLKDVRLSRYTGKTALLTDDAAAGDSLKVFEQRHPCLQVQWKPDIERLVAGIDKETAIKAYIEEFVQQQSIDLADTASLAVIGSLVDLAGHRRPRMRVLEVGSTGCQCTARQMLELLDKSTAFPRVRSWHAAEFDAEGVLAVEDGAEGPFDVIVVPQLSSSQRLWQTPEKITELVGDNGIVIGRKTSESTAALEATGFSLIDLQQQVVLGVRPLKTSHLQGRKALIVTKTSPSEEVKGLASALSAYLPKAAGVTQADILALEQLTKDHISEDVIVISLLELESEFLATVSPQDMDSLRLFTNVVTSLVWVTGANMLGDSPDPNLTLATGLSRALMLEQPSLRFALLDIGLPTDLKVESHVESTCEVVLRVLASAVSEGEDDTEFIQSNGLLHISRFGAAQDLNRLFRQRLDPAEPLAKKPLGELTDARLSIGQVGITDTLHFQELERLRTAPPAGYVDVSLRAVSLNAKDIYAMSGHVETHLGTTALDFSGVVTAVGTGVDGLQPGDRAVVWAPNHFGTVERVPAGCVHKLLPEEDLTVVPALLTVHATALHALRNCAHLRAGESVLIHAGAGAFGLAAIAFAKRIGAVVYTTVGSDGKKDFLVKEHGVPESHIFHSRSTSFVAALKAATNGRGVDVVVNSLVGELLHASWASLAPFGRFVEIGKRELVDAGKLDMGKFLKNATFTAFDLSEFFFAEDQFYRDTWNSLMAEVLELYRAGLIEPSTIATFDIKDVAQAYRYFNSKDRVGKVVVSLEDPKSVVPVAPAKYQTVFSPEKMYLMIGCLGGLGRSLSRWMMSRGARRFVFLGRSGCDKPSAAQLVSRIREAGAHVTVVRGDVSSADHVNAAVAACVETGYPIGGVIQAAMGLHEALFTKMTNEAWHTGIDPKWQGTWNLHRALEGNDAALDFFLFTSSVSGSVGTATESNYCSANAFLDAFARWRRSRGKPATSVGLGMIAEVGYLHENPEIEALLLRKGIQPLNEEEFLQVIDMGLAGTSPQNAEATRLDAAAAHILTGLEGFSIRKLLAQGFDVNNGTMQDPRAAFLSASLAAEQDARRDASGAAGSKGNNAAADAAPWFKDIPASSSNLLASEADAPTLLEAILRMTRKRFSNLILIPRDQIDDRRPMPQFGVDSMIASEFRTWFWTAFRVDIPFLTIMSSQTALVTLAEFVEGKLVEGWKTA
ncbi:hypothetical protein BJX76DRAFT_362324 [Aspergillus varians]